MRLRLLHELPSLLFPRIARTRPSSPHVQRTFFHLVEAVAFHLGHPIATLLAHPIEIFPFSSISIHASNRDLDLLDLAGRRRRRHRRRFPARMARTPTKPQRSIASFFRPGDKEVAAEDEVVAERTRKDEAEAKPSIGSESEGDGHAEMMSMQVVEDVVVPKEDGMERTSRKRSAKVLESDDEVQVEEEEEYRESSPSEEPIEEINTKNWMGARKNETLKKSKSDSGIGKEAIGVLQEYQNYQPNKEATWKPGSPVPYKFLAKVLQEIRQESKRLRITRILANAFRTVIATTPQDLVYCVYLCSNTLAPAHHGLELGIGESTLMRAIAEATGRKESSIKAEYHQTGDLGDVAQNAKAKQRVMFPPPPLTVKAVFDSFLAIAKESGSKSQDKKRGRIQKLLVSAKEEEPGYIIRSLQGKLRIGLAGQTILVAIAHAVYLQSNAKKTAKSEDMALHLEEASQKVKQVFSECPDYKQLVEALLSEGIQGFAKLCKFRIGIPVRPMLAKPTAGVSEVLERFSGTKFTCEYKYDGERAQIHIMEGGSVKIYSRNAEDTTAKYLDVAAIIPTHLHKGIKDVVIDSEIVAYDREKHEILPFQILSTRSKKETDIKNIKVQVCVFAFDCLYLNGEPLLQKTLVERRSAMHAALREESGLLEFAKFKTSTDVEELQDFLNESVEAKTEGLIVKTLTENATYEPSKRSFNWLKLKKDYIDGLGDSLDLVVIGAWYGKGKRTGVFGAFLLACYNEDTEEFQSVCKLGTGLSDEDLQSHSKELRQFIAEGPKSYYRYGETLAPDVWFETQVVWEIKAADLSISPVHKAGAGVVDSSKGISLRFPRLIRSREDKSPEAATTSTQIVDMYRAQSLRSEEKGPKMDEADYW